MYDAIILYYLFDEKYGIAQTSYISVLAVGRAAQFYSWSLSI
jgi:hypothetical protein